VGSQLVNPPFLGGNSWFPGIDWFIWPGMNWDDLKYNIFVGCKVISTNDALQHAMPPWPLEANRPMTCLSIPIQQQTAVDRLTL
jgi:hypothetical protein